MTDEFGQEFYQLYPKSDDLKRCSAIICDYCDIIAYAQTQAAGTEGEEVLSTLHLKGGGCRNVIPKESPLKMSLWPSKG